MLEEKDSVDRLLAIMARLRDPESGCPWDQKQTFESIVPHTIEEAYEVADAIYSGNMDAIKDECGDLLFQIVFYAQLAKEQGSFDFHDVSDAISNKLERRHPHVFAQKTQLNAEQLSKQWDEIKQSEKGPRSNFHSVFDNLPSGLPALKQAYKMQKACAKVGFDWPSPEPVLDKVKEEIIEIQGEMESETRDSSALEEEIGDAFFALVNLSRHFNIDADAALRKASHKFQTRFEHIESIAREAGINLHEASLDQMEVWWQQVKHNDTDK